MIRLCEWGSAGQNNKDEDREDMKMCRGVCHGAEVRNELPSSVRLGTRFNYY